MDPYDSGRKPFSLVRKPNAITQMKNKSPETVNSTSDEARQSTADARENSTIHPDKHRSRIYKQDEHWDRTTSTTLSMYSSSNKHHSGGRKHHQSASSSATITIRHYSVTTDRTAYANITTRGNSSISNIGHPPEAFHRSTTCFPVEETINAAASSFSSSPQEVNQLISSCGISISSPKTEAHQAAEVAQVVYNGTEWY
ncbi:uncharacterized protein LOC129741980 [Uranotaenia lowii]|uniref:uncharacterized protein LOC129741980 n=1 Tax=Uranotaenia lowii TaxID=190385 RepID=UPI002479AA3C|nr:uncharacterized protein LOC129741980 [Uranotaenia lowii]